MSVTTVQGKAPNSYSRSMSEQASVTTGMPSSAPASSQVRAVPTPYSASSNQRIDERFSFRNLAGGKTDLLSRNAAAGTPAYSQSVFAGESPGSNADTLIQNAASMDDEGSVETRDHNTNFRQILADLGAEQYQAGYSSNAGIVYSAQSLVIVAVAVGKSATVTGLARKVARTSNIRVLVAVFAHPSQKAPLQTRTMIILVFLLSVSAAASSFSGPLFGEAAADNNAAGSVYRSNTGTNLLNSVKYREWDPSTQIWSSEVELPNTGSPIRDAKILYSPTDTMRVVVSHSADGTLNLFKCTSSCTIAASWTIESADFADTGAPSTTNSHRPFDIAFEQTSSKLLVVYDKALNENNDFYYRTYDGTTLSAETGISYTGAAADSEEIRYFKMASKSGSNEIAMILLDTSNAIDVAFFWSGSSFSAGTTIASGITSTNPDGQSIDIAYESQSGAAVAFVGRDVNDAVYARYAGSWAITGNIDTDPAKQNVNMLNTLKPDPSSNKIMILTMCGHTGGGGGNNPEMAGESNSGTPSGWNTLVNDLDSSGAVVTNAWDFAWNPTGSEGLLMYGKGADAVTTIKWSASAWGTTTTITAAGEHPWIVAATNPSGADTVNSLFLTQNSNFDIGSMKYDGTTVTNTGDSTHTAGTTVNTFKGMSIDFYHPQAVFRSITENAGLTETLARSSTLFRSLSEQLAVTETTARTFTGSRLRSEQLAITESIIKSTTYVLSDGLAMAETIDRAIMITIPLAEQLGLTDMVIKATATTLTEQFATGDVLVKTATLTRTAAESLALQDTISKAVSPVIMEQLTLTELADRSVVQSRLIAEQLATSDTMTTSVVKPLSESLVMTDAITRSMTQSRSMIEQTALTDASARTTTASRTLIEQLGATDTISITVSRSLSEQIALTETIARSAMQSRSMAEQFATTESIAVVVAKQPAEQFGMTESISISVSRSIADNLAVSDTISGSPFVFIIITDSMAIDDEFTDISIEFHLDLAEPLVLAQGFATDFEGLFNQVDSEGIIIGDSVSLLLEPTGQVVNRDITESMNMQDSLTLLIVVPPPSPPPVITTMPNLMMTQTDDLDVYVGLTVPAEAVEVDGIWNVDSLDEQGLESLIDAIGMPVYDVDLEAISGDIRELTVILPTFKVSMNVSGQPSDDGMFLTPTLSNLPAGLQVIILIDVEASMNGSANLDHLGSAIVTFTPAESTDDFAMLITLLDNNPESPADELPNDTPAFYIEISIVGNFTGPTPSDGAFFEEPPQITFTITEDWAQEQSVERDSDNIPIIHLLLLDEGSGEWIELADEVEPPASAVDGIYIYTATVPHFSTYAVAAGFPNTSDDSSRGSNRDRTFTRLLSESLFVSSIANLGVPAGSEGKIVIKDITESLTLRIVQPQPLHERVITINDITVAASIVDVRSAATLGTAVATLNFEFINKGITTEELVLRFWYPDPAGGDIVYEAEQTITAGAGESIVEEVKIPFSSPGLYDVMIEVESEDGILSTTDIVVDVPWLTVYLYILMVIAIVVVLASIAYVIYAMRRSGLFIIGGK
jgi:PGF-pre-PGF domain-containing protein